MKKISLGERRANVLAAFEHPSTGIVTVGIGAEIDYGRSMAVLQALDDPLAGPHDTKVAASGSWFLPLILLFHGHP
ncbi:hypothetical protein [Beijerinckia indica]|uniref:Uncharacterized protein n=1 Tax=Beijerinckia indica subsp. indica (strain ATCC 9039 / DSM 1715 / NCIMB 8712) TaxID=395963 RepID=B2IE92_BEII9|nr:hypothetical protein [Beijerinckia indica]ACB94119.1 hypothetical protein Bind_0466 [Beijerinckia indica subsp. indica ATCC 9039]